MNITDIQDSCQIGSELCVIFKTGQQFYGILSEIRETSIVLRLASGNKMPISLDAIATAFSDAYNLAEIQDSKPLTQPISQTEVRSPTLDSVLENASLPATTYESKQTYPIEVLTQAASIAARFEIGTQQASLEPLPIDLTVPKEISSLLYSVKKTKMQGEWDKLRNKYNNAIKNDPSRLKQIARDFEHLSETYTELSAAAKFNLGCLQISLGETSQALQTFQVAAVNHQESRLFYNLAAVALKKNEPEKACYALQSFFQQESLSKHMTVWCKFLALAMRANALSGLDDLLKHVIQNGSRSDTQLILESAVYILKFHNQIDDAYNLIAFTLQGVFEPEQTLAILQSMLSKLYLQPSESYRQQAEQLLEAAQQSQQSQERAKLQRDVTRIIESAKGFGNRGMYSQAIAEIRKALQLAPNDTTLKELEEDYREAQRDKGLPKGDGPYAQARHAKIKIKDFVKAEKLYQEAIKQGDRFDSAVNDLSSLLMQLNRDEEAIELLQKYRHKVSKRETTNNLLADAYKRLGQYKEEITCLQEVLRQTPSDKQNTVLNRIALAQYRMRDYQEFENTSKRVLRQNPKDEVAQTRLESYRKAKETNIYTELDALFRAQENTAAARTSLGSLLTYHLEQCDYTGVEAAKVPSKDFTEKDVDKLENAANRKLGIERPRERASYFLSAAKILIELGATVDDDRPRSFLRNFCAAMGDAYVAEGKRDVSRSYYAEAFLITPEWVNRRIGQLYVKLTQYIMLHYSTPEAILRVDSGDSIASCLEKALENPHSRTSVIEGLLYLSWLNREVGQVLISRIYQLKRLRELVQNICYQILGERREPTANQADFLALWERGRDLMRRLNQEVEEEFAFLNSVAGSLDSLQDQIKRIETVKLKVRGGLDQQRLNRLNEILSSLYDYSQQQSYIQREYPAETVKNRITKFIEEVENEPTRYSWSLFRDYVLKLERTIKEHFDKMQRLAEPRQLQTQLLINSYSPDLESKIECQLTLFNEQDKSPAGDILVYIKESPIGAYTVLKSVISAKDLPGGESFTLKFPIKVNEEAKISQVFTLYYHVSFSTRRGNAIEIHETQSIRLYSSDDFKTIKNPYTYAHGSIVEDESIFIGRDQLITKLISDVEASSSAKSLVIYGQKRAGKSSILYHLKQRLKFPIISIEFSAGDLGGDFSVANFLNTIIQEIEQTFQELEDKGYPRISIERPTDEDIERNPLPKFRDYMFQITRIFKQIDEYRNVRIMLLIDEFTYIYGEIIKGRVDEGFMKSWKALLERRYFGTVLVGQDTMPRFIERFPNEFQVAEPQRVSYLAEEDARHLIVEPIKIPGKGESEASRYKGEAVKRLLELTAGSPYYIQIFCNRLVQYMNTKKAIYVSDADIEEVKKDLIIGSEFTGSNPLGETEFDNLISAGDFSIDNIPKDDSILVLQDIAQGSRFQDYCDRSLITANTTVHIETVLEDLVRREVIAKRDNAFRIRVGLFKEWLLTH